MTTGSPYRPRFADDELAGRLQRSGAVLIDGPKACGKTETARRRAASEVRLDVDPSVPLMPDFFVPEEIKPPEGVKGGV